MEEHVLTELISKIPEIRPGSNFQNGEPSTVSDNQRYFDFLIQRGEIISAVFRKMSDDFGKQCALHKSEWVSLTRLYAFFEFRRQKNYILRVFNTLKALGIEHLAIQTIEGVQTASGNEILVMRIFLPSDEKNEIIHRYKYLSDKYRLSELEDRYFHTAYSDGKYRYALRFMPLQNTDYENPEIAPPREAESEACRFDLIPLTEQVGIALYNAHRRFVRRAEYHRNNWNNDKVFELDRELNSDIKNLFPEKSVDIAVYRKDVKKTMLDRIINRALRIVAGQRCIYISVDCRKRKLVIEAYTDVHHSTEITEEERMKIEELNIHADYRYNRCERCLKWPHEICICQDKDEITDQCCILDALCDDVKSCLCVPVIFNERTMGIIHIDGLLPHQFDLIDKENMTNFSNSVAPHLQHQLILDSLNDLHLIALEPVDIRDRIEKIVKLVCQATLSDYASIWLWHESEKKLKIHSTVGYEIRDPDDERGRAFCLENEGICGKVIHKRYPIAVYDIRETSEDVKYKEQLLEQGIRSIMSYPMSITSDRSPMFTKPDRILGVINIMNRDPVSYSESMKSYFQILVDQVSFVIFKLIEGAMLRAQIGHETQTMLLNISGQANRLQELIKKGIRKNREIAKENISTVIKSLSDESASASDLKLLNKTISLLDKFPFYKMNKVMNDIIEKSDQAHEKVTSIIESFDIDLQEENSDQKEMVLFSLIKEIVNGNRQAINNRNLKYDISFKDTRSDNVSSQQQFKIWMNEEIFEMIFGNILNNAIKYSFRQRKIIIEVEVFEENFTISVTNRGIGIPEKFFHNIWEKGFRLADEDCWPCSIRKPDGKGLGLTIANGAASLYQGEVSLKHSHKLPRKKGCAEEWKTCFEIIFPAILARENIFKRRT